MRKWANRILLSLVYAIVVLLPIGVVGFITAVEVAVHRSEFPENLDAGKKSRTPTYLDRDRVVLAQLATDDARVHVPVELEEMGEWLPAMTVALEDHRFEEHLGVDWYAIAAAAARNVRNPGRISGASTISQQVIKQADRRQGRKLKAKLREAVLALKLERSWEKDQILAAYLNRLDYGNRRLGPEGAAMAYFGKKAKNLTQPEAIFLAGLPQSPSRYNPWRHPERAFSKYQRSLERLHVLGILDEPQRDLFSSNPPVILRESPVNRAPMFLQAALGDRPMETGTHRTTLDFGLQETAEQMLRSQFDAINRHDVRNGAVVVIENQSGAVLALASAAKSDADGESAINGAIIPRHAGSTLKPFVYLMGIDEKKFTAATVFTDTPDAVALRYADYDPHNFNRGFRGPVRLREALANSMNIPAVLALDQIGARRCFFELEEWGLHENERFEDLGAGFVLGNLRVSLLDLTAAYAGLARGGLAAEPHFFADSPASSQRRIASPDATKIIEDILSDNDARKQAFGSDSPLNLGWRAAVKTGTSSSFRDAWTVGFCKDYTVGVWVGNYDGQSMSGSLAVQTASPIWRRMMKHLKNQHGARPLDPIEARGEMVVADVCPLSGLLPEDEAHAEWFLRGTVPAGSSSLWFDEESGKPQLPGEYATWIDSKHNHLGAVLQPPEGGGIALEIISPKDGLTYVIDRDLPETQQALELRALTDDEKIEWDANGEQVVGKHWQLQPGTWKFTAQGASGAKATVEIIVE